MNTFSRRNFIKLSGAAALAGTIGIPSIARAAGGKVVIVGGGVGGATTARYLKIANPAIDVTLIEPNAVYHTCFMSNEVLAGERTLEGISVGYDGLKALGVNVVQDMATGIDPAAKTVTVGGGSTFAFDHCVVAPGISFNYTIEGATEADAGKIPHAWKAGEQTALLRSQLEAMDDGGLVCIIAPPNPFRCPPGPYERASLIAHYLKMHKPKSKLMILDPKEKFSKQGLFMQAWKDLYGYDTDNSLIAWNTFSKVGGVSKIDPAAMTVETDFETFKPAVINYIPAQKAGKIAMDADLTDDSGWCPVDKKTFESKKHAGIHVIGDASIATAMPKSGYSANSQGKVTAAAIASALAGVEAPEPSYVNTCYSIAGADYGFSVAAVYRYNAEKDVIAGVEGAGGLTPMDASAEQRKREVAFAHSWYNNIRKDTWG
ncbi:MAG: cytochrome C [Hyphomicrobiales bacterium]|nr:MAG: cytochrome C [Hyphomicrobiales bacterium]